jgi:hypothetical protein
MTTHLTIVTNQTHYNKDLQSEYQGLYVIFPLTPFNYHYIPIDTSSDVFVGGSNAKYVATRGLQISPLSSGFRVPGLGKPSTLSSAGRFAGPMWRRNYHSSHNKDITMQVTWRIFSSKVPSSKVPSHNRP